MVLILREMCRRFGRKIQLCFALLFSYSTVIRSGLLAMLLRSSCEPQINSGFYALTADNSGLTWKFIIECETTSFVLLYHKNWTQGLSAWRKPLSICHSLLSKLYHSSVYQGIYTKL